MAQVHKLHICWCHELPDFVGFQAHFDSFHGRPGAQKAAERGIGLAQNLGAPIAFWGLNSRTHVYHNHASLNCPFWKGSYIICWCQKMMTALQRQLHFLTTGAKSFQIFMKWRNVVDHQIQNLLAPNILGSHGIFSAIARWGHTAHVLPWAGHLAPQLDHTLHASSAFLLYVRKQKGTSSYQMHVCLGIPQYTGTCYSGGKDTFPPKFPAFRREPFLTPQFMTETESDKQTDITMPKMKDGYIRRKTRILIPFGKESIQKCKEKWIQQLEK